MSQGLTLALKARGDEGEPLPGVFQGLETRGARQRRSTVTLVGGASGGGKSSLALHMAVRMRYSQERGVPTLYFSADCDRVTVATPVLAGLMDVSQEAAEKLILAEDAEAYELFERATDHIWWCFEPSPSLNEIKEEIEAYAHVYGEYPHNVIVDNIMDLSVGGSEMEKFGDVMLFLNNTARFTSAHIMALCHVKGSHINGTNPIPKSGLLWNIDKKPRLILTLHKAGEALMGVRVVKNTRGPADSEGNFGINLRWLPAKGYFSE